MAGECDHTIEKCGNVGHGGAGVTSKSLFFHVECHGLRHYERKP